MNDNQEVPQSTASSGGVQRRIPRTNPKLNAYRVGLRRGMLSMRIILTSPAEIIGAVIPIVLFAVLLLFMQRWDFDNAAVGLGVMIFPSIIAMNVLFSAIIGMSSTLSFDRTNGALLRSKSVPGGTTGYLIGEILSNAMVTVSSTLLILGVGLLLFDDLVFDSPLRWPLFALVLCVGLVATVSLGAALGSMVNSPKNIGIVMFPVVGLIGISGIFYPLVALPIWLQWVAQFFPLYWFGLGMRASLLPESMAGVEIGESWRIEWVFIVLAAWAIMGLLFAPKLLSRMAKRESGSAMAARQRGVQAQLGAQTS